jgi:hypothetical protein
VRIIFGIRGRCHITWFGFVYSTPRRRPECGDKGEDMVVLAARLAMVQLVVAAGVPQSQTGPESWVKDTKVRGNAGKPTGNLSVSGIGCGIRPRFVTVIVKTSPCQEKLRSIVLVKLRSALAGGGGGRVSTAPMSTLLRMRGKPCRADQLLSGLFFDLRPTRYCLRRSPG